MPYGEQASGSGAAERRSQTPRKSIAERLEGGEITHEDAATRARESLLRMLTASAKSRRELEQALARKGYPESVVTPLLDRFDEVGLVDDAAYAGMIVRTRQEERGLARRAISAELRRRGVDEETATEALDQIDPEDERVAGARLAGKLIARTRGKDRVVRVRRAVGSLARKGYAPGLAFELVRESLEAEGAQTDDLSYEE